MQCDPIWLPKFVVTDAITIQMPTLQVRVQAENAGVGVRQWTAGTIGIRQDMGGIKTQQIDNIVWECILEITESMSIINKQEASLEQWDLLQNYCVTRIGDLASTRSHWLCYMAEKTNLNGQKLQAPPEEFADVALC